jgi:hypothetical protein
VIGYLDAVNAHDAAAARDYLAPETQLAMAREIPMLRGLSGRRRERATAELPPGISPTGLEAQNPHYRDLIEFGVVYDAVFRTTTDFATSGPQARVFVVGRSRVQGTWLILGIGTGP